MDETISTQIKQIILSSLSTNTTPDVLTDDYQLVGNILDSMAVTNLILALEEHFGFVFNDEELSAEAFETVRSLAELVKKKVTS